MRSRAASAKRIRDPYGKAAEIAVACDQFADAVLDAQRRDVGIVNQIARHSGLSHVSATIHQIKELVTVEQIHTGLLDRLPAAKRECSIVLWSLNQGLPKEIVGHALERPPFADCLLLDPLQQVIINCQRRSGHASKCTN